MAAPRAINLLVIHCSASPNGKRVTSEEIDAWHKARGFKRQAQQIGFNEPRLQHIGYHYVIYAEGAVRIGRGESEIGAHAQGYNQKSIGICMVGTDRFSASQWLALRQLVTALRARYADIHILGHRDLAPDQNRNGHIEPFEWLKTCPGFDVANWLARGMTPLSENLLQESIP